MKAAYICADAGIPVFGQKGCSIHVQEVIRALMAKQVEVSLFTNRLGGEAPPDLEAVKVYQLPAIPKVERSIREKVARSINPDLELELTLAQPFDFVYERYSLWSYSGMEYAQRVGIPGILEVNAPLISEQVQHRGLIDRSQAEAIASRVFQAATIIITVSEEVKQYVAGYINSPEKIVVIPNGVNPQRFQDNLAEKRAMSSSLFTIGFVGTLKPWHGVNILIDSFALFHRYHPYTRLLIVGNGPEHDRLKAKVKEKNLDSAVLFTGAVPPETIPHWLTQMDVAVAPYPDSEDFYFSPLKVYEYMAAGLPVVASDIGQLKTMITKDVNGILIPPGDAIALANAITKLWQSPLLRQSIGSSARQQILQEHTWERVAEKILWLVRQKKRRLEEVAS